MSTMPNDPQGSNYLQARLAGRRLTRRARMLPGVGLVAVLGLAASACGSSTPTVPPSTTTTLSAAQIKAANIAAVKSSWTTFFSYNTPESKRITLLQNGSTYAADLAKEVKFFPKGTAATVKSVTVNGTTATVHYSLADSTGVLLPSSTGTAVEVNGRWLVSSATFCSLATLAGATCPS